MLENGAGFGKSRTTKYYTPAGRPASVWRSCWRPSWSGFRAPQGDPTAPLASNAFPILTTTITVAPSLMCVDARDGREGAKNSAFSRPRPRTKCWNWVSLVPERKAVEKLVAGEVGYFDLHVKDIKDIHIGDTVTIPGDNRQMPLGQPRPRQIVASRS